MKEISSSSMIKLTDSIGQISISKNVFYGPFTHRSITNFNVSDQTVNLSIIHAYILVKKCAANINFSLGYLCKKKAEAITSACDDILDGRYDNEFVVNKYQGGAGTSTNMNVNEVIANIALEKMGYAKHTYSHCHPINDINRHQSTNDTYPTAVKIAIIRKIRALADSLSELQSAFQQKESKYGNVLKLGRTQLMDGVPILAGQMFGAYADVISRDRWRIYKSEERLRYVNIGGTAIGTGINAPLEYSFKIIDLLQKETNLGLARADNLIDNTQNLDAFTEVSGLISVAATNITKICNDLRLLSSGPNSGIGEISLEKRQDGSTIMPGKTNPVIMENTIQCCQRVVSNNLYIHQLTALGNLELNAFLPSIAETMIESLDLLTNSINLLKTFGIDSLTVNKEICLENLEKSHSLITPLIAVIGYDKTSQLVKETQNKNTTIKHVLYQSGILPKEEIDQLLDPHNLTHAPRKGVKNVIK